MKLTRYAPAGLVLLGLGLRLFLLTSNRLWYDEAYTLLLARLPFLTMIGATSSDVHPPLYYMLVQAVYKGLPGVNPEFSLRILSVVFSGLCLLRIWELSAELKLSAPARLTALGIMAVLPVEIYYAQEARMYAMLQWIVLTQWAALVKRDWGRLALFATIGMYTHNYGLIYAGLVYLVALVRDRRAWRMVVLSGAIALAAWLPWVVVLARQMANVAGGYWIQPVTATSMIYALFQITQTTNMRPELVMVAAPALGMLVFVAAWHGIKTRRFALLALAFGPLALAVIVSLVWKPVLLHRGLIGSVPALVLLAAEAIHASRRAWFWGAVNGLAVMGALAGLVRANIQGDAKGDFTGILDTRLSPPVLVHINEGTMLPWMVYRPNTRHYLLNTGCPGDPGILTDRTRAEMGIPTIELTDLRRGWAMAYQIGPLSTECEEQFFHRLTDGREPVALYEVPIGVYGIWEYER